MENNIKTEFRKEAGALEAGQNSHFEEIKIDNPAKIE